MSTDKVSYDAIVSLCPRCGLCPCPPNSFVEDYPCLRHPEGPVALELFNGGPALALLTKTWHAHPEWRAEVEAIMRRILAIRWRFYQQYHARRA